MVQAVAEYSPKEFIPVTANVHSIDASASFSLLSQQEALYAYYMARASWDGSKICWFQRSYEAPALLVLFKLIFTDGIDKFKEDSMAAGLTEDEWKQLLVYCAAVFQNCGNFKSFGDTKFVPQLSQDKFVAAIQASSAYKTHKKVIDTILDKTFAEVYSEADPLARIGFRDSNGVSSYYSGNITKDDTTYIDEFCQRERISPLNTRLLKSEDGNTFELLVCSRDADKAKTPYLGTYEEEGGKKVIVRAGDFGTFMAQVVSSMEKAMYYTSDENQAKMIENYVEHFIYGE